MEFNSFLEQNRERIEGFEKDPSGLGYFIDEFWRRVEDLSEVKSIVLLLGLFKLLGYNKFIYRKDDEFYVDTGKDLAPFYSPYVDFYGPKDNGEVKAQLMDERVLRKLPKEWFDYLFDHLEVVEDPSV